MASSSAAGTQRPPRAARRSRAADRARARLPARLARPAPAGRRRSRCSSPTSPPRPPRRGSARSSRSFALGHPWNVLAVIPVALAVTRRTRASAARARRRSTPSRPSPTSSTSATRTPTGTRSASPATSIRSPGRSGFRTRTSTACAGRRACTTSARSPSTPPCSGKPGKLTPDEWGTVWRAPRLSARLLRRFELSAAEARAVEYHHERFDGKGYYGLPAEQQPLASHFLSLRRQLRRDDSRTAPTARA